MSENTLDSVTRRMSEYMLKGWVLTDQECPNGCGVPLMRTKDHSETFCAGCVGNEANPQESGPGLQTGLTMSMSHVVPDVPPEVIELEDLETSSDVQKELVASNAENLEASKVRREQSERTTQRLAEKMLQGWTLLGDACPNPRCIGTPLVQPKNGPKQCVTCDSLVMDDAEFADYQKKANQTTVDKSPKFEESPLSPTGDVPLVQTESRSLGETLATVEEPKVKSKDKSKRKDTDKAKTKPHPSRRHCKTRRASQSAVTASLQTIDATLGSVNRKLVDLQRQLEDCDDPCAICDVVDAMTHCGATMRKLAKARRTLAR
ncbi:hypothetical protein IWQ62_004704 [Dispira parvispora]|uniref:Uncharacterized protein n=1 Tax=Dispira parvispora TaxID=1520584 RepID=A0A9W8E5D3_9FUNG|nr:hypothetical protein IWQ62_004704 [Dispira parvispora]